MPLLYTGVVYSPLGCVDMGMSGILPAATAAFNAFNQAAGTLLLSIALVGSDDG